MGGMADGRAAVVNSIKLLGKAGYSWDESAGMDVLRKLSPSNCQSASAKRVEADAAVGSRSIMMGD